MTTLGKVRMERAIREKRSRCLMNKQNNSTFVVLSCRTFFGMRVEMGRMTSNKVVRII